MKDLQDLKDLTIHDVQPIIEEYAQDFVKDPYVSNPLDPVIGIPKRHVVLRKAIVIESWSESG